ncbi:hypothetical protein VTL71DRAFT_10253 [Oculimacula yallundae]|uniref:Zn(2)-C6 fungal-type domain-containing protein n=1 Tax=Oculimacula yallundae TaxID=86028 RepID=A0ABR4CSR2_9HELO
MSLQGCPSEPSREGVHTSLSMPVRQRRSLGRATTGCITCKIRRVKCDERKPSCRRCTSTGRKCDGYAPAKPTSARYGTSRTLAYSPLQPAPNQDICGSDSQYFDFFRSYALQDLSIVFDATYWNRFILQACHYEPAIKHAAIAVGSLYEQFRFRDAWTVKYTLSEDNPALKHYLKAISLILHNDGSEHASRVALIVCVMFISFENMRGYSGAALRHIDGGIRILQQLQAKETSSSVESVTASHNAYVPNSLLVNMFIRLDVAASQMVITRPLLLGDVGLPPTFPGIRPLSFQELNTTLSEILTAGFKLSRASWMCPAGALYVELRQRHLQELYRLRSSMEVWSKEFESFQNQKLGKLDTWTRERIRILKVIQITIAVILDVEPAEARENGDMIWDRYKAEFVSIISIADSIVEEARKKSPITGKPVPRYMPDTGLINPLWCVVHWCRDPHLRRKAIDILDRAACRDGFWDSELCVRTGKIIMMLEEKDLGDVNCAADIPLWKRICVIDPKFAEDGGGALVKYTRASKSGGTDDKGLALKEVYEETVRW